MTGDRPADETQAALVYIYGPPAVGKLTVAQEFARLGRYRLFHNHLTVNAIRSVFDFGSEPFSDVLHRLRLDVFDTAIRSGINVIFTNNSAWSGPDPRERFVAFASRARQIAEEGGGRALFVRLTAPLAVLEARVASQSRQEHAKLVDVVRLRQLISLLDQSPLHPDDLTVDTSRLEPPEAASEILRRLL